MSSSSSPLSPPPPPLLATARRRRSRWSPAPASPPPASSAVTKAPPTTHHPQQQQQHSRHPPHHHPANRANRANPSNHQQQATAAGTMGGQSKRQRLTPVSFEEVAWCDDVMQLHEREAQDVRLMWLTDERNADALACEWPDVVLPPRVASEELLSEDDIRWRVLRPVGERDQEDLGRRAASGASPTCAVEMLSGQGRAHWIDIWGTRRVAWLKDGSDRALDVDWADARAVRDRLHAETRIDSTIWKFRIRLDTDSPVAEPRVGGSATKPWLFADALFRCLRRTAVVLLPNPPRLPALDRALSGGGGVDGSDERAQHRAALLRGLGLLKTDAGSGREEEEEVEDEACQLPEAIYERLLLRLHAFWTGTAATNPDQMMRTPYYVQVMPRGSGDDEKTPPCPPTAHTCIRTICLPDYRDEEEMRRGLEWIWSSENHGFRFV